MFILISFFCNRNRSQLLLCFSPTSSIAAQRACALCNILNLNLATKRLESRLHPGILFSLAPLGAWENGRENPSVSDGEIAAARCRCVARSVPTTPNAPSKLGSQSGDFTQPPSKIRGDFDCELKRETCHSAGGPGSGNHDTDWIWRPGTEGGRGWPPLLERRIGATDFEISRAFSRYSSAVFCCLRASAVSSPSLKYLGFC